MKIGELATASGTPVDTIRFYEREGLLPAPARSAANYRQYEAAHLERLQFIRHCRTLDMSLTQVRELLRVRAATPARRSPRRAARTRRWPPRYSRCRC